ncbi:hypothetical protein PBOR_11395 [Paenibacillus borealis]|uniref:Uncharacterized protein n=2 Tax=Paenibacillus borealis TaxID=160799 RepID=A0A089LEA5_PAEBO|nr:hypothetical protein PBOR_11395 [Paenibacillus borealis]
MPALNQLQEDRNPLKVYGSRLCRGNMDAALVHVFGHLHVKGNLTTARLKLLGECSIGRSCAAQEITSFGSLRVQSLQAKKVVSNGYLSVTRDAAADEFQADGCVRANSLSCGKSIHIKLGSPCKVRHMMAEREITVSPSSKLINGLMSPFRRLRCETIEARAITLYKTQADIVSGVNITVGPGCVIQEIRYSGTLIVHPKSRVGKTILIHESGGLIK